MTTTPGKEPPIDYDEMVALIASEFDHGAVACELCDATLALTDTGDNVFVMEIRHDEDCPLLQAIYEMEES